MEIIPDPEIQCQWKIQDIIPCHRQILEIITLTGFSVFSQILRKLKILIQYLKAVSALRVRLDHVLVRIFLITDPKQIIIVTDLNGPLICKRIRIHHVDTSPVLRYSIRI